MNVPLHQRVATRTGHRRVPTRALAVASLVLLGTLPLSSIATAAVDGARATGTSSIGAGSWGATASVSTITFTTNTDQTVTVTNTGTIALSARSYTVTISKPATKKPRFTIFRCAVPWVSTKCSGGSGTQIGGTLSSNSTTTITSTAPLAPSASLYLQIEPSKVGSSTTVVIVPQVTAPSQLRPPVKNNQ